MKKEREKTSVFPKEMMTRKEKSDAKFVVIFRLRVPD